MTRWQRALWLADLGLNCSRAVVDGAAHTLRSIEREVIASLTKAAMARSVQEQQRDEMERNPDTFDLDHRDTYS